MDKYTFPLLHTAEGLHIYSPVHPVPLHTSIVARLPAPCYRNPNFVQTAPTPSPQDSWEGWLCNHLKVNLIYLNNGDLLPLTVNSLVCTWPSLDSEKWEVSRTLPEKVCLLIKETHRDGLFCCWTLSMKDSWNFSSYLETMRNNLKMTKQKDERNTQAWWGI